MSYGILLIRVVLGLVMAGHGAQKLFGWWGGPGLCGVYDWLGSSRFRGGWAPVLLLVASEFVGGLLLVLGLLVPFAALAVVSVMFVAIATTHRRNGFWNGNGGYEFNVLIVAAATALAAIGGGRFSLDNAFGWGDNLSGLWWAVGVLGVAALGALFMLTLGRRPERATAGKPDQTQTLRTA